MTAPLLGVNAREDFLHEHLIAVLPPSVLPASCAVLGHLECNSDRAVNLQMILRQAPCIRWKVWEVAGEEFSGMRVLITISDERQTQARLLQSGYSGEGVEGRGETWAKWKLKKRLLLGP